MSSSDRYKDLVEATGRKVDETSTQDSTTLISFKEGPLSMLIVLESPDEKFIRVMLPNFYDIPEEKVSSALLAINKVAMRCKGAKVHLTPNGDDVFAVAEFLDTEGMDSKTLDRYISMVVSAAGEFAKEMK